MATKKISAKAGIQKIAAATELVAKTALPGNPKSLSKPQKLKAIGKFDEALSKADSDLLKGIRQVLESQRSNRKAGLGTWAVELSDPDFPIAIATLDETQKERDEKLLNQMTKALERTRASTIRLAKAHKNEH